jgi:hypothetical protein
MAAAQNPTGFSAVLSPEGAFTPSMTPVPPAAIW